MIVVLLLFLQNPSLGLEVLNGASSSHGIRSPLWCGQQLMKAGTEWSHCATRLSNKRSLSKTRQVQTKQLCETGARGGSKMRDC